MVTSGLLDYRVRVRVGWRCLHSVHVPRTRSKHINIAQAVDDLNVTLARWSEERVRALVDLHDRCRHQAQCRFELKEMAGSARGRVVLFGKTGAGKSTVANALVTGGIEDIRFTIGHGIKGCTSTIQTSEGRGWTVIDTVGLGEGQGGLVSSDDAEKMILNFLREVKGQYSHVIYVKASDNRFDVLDDTIWNSFKRIFKGADTAFTVLFTKGTEEWLKENRNDFPKWVKDVGDNVFITNIPPVNKKPVREERNQAVRKESIAKLESDLLAAFESRGGTYATPDIANMDDSALAEESQSILAYIRDMFRNLVSIVFETLNICSIFAMFL